ncbi:MAG TPA: hypothetical protein PK200_08880 [Spirochaetota bacterium]|jgi:hypothetical protein|nr:hypothetical protein [Spirochaetota bacterium]HQO01522.1 hypothetical protein [Spirochaetota bacterium]HQP47855.1 hypothetical protein [Spirochaetota bacterium]
MIKLWFMEQVVMVMGNVNRVLFLLFLPGKGNLSIVDRMVYRILVKMVIVEKRLDQALEECFRVTSIKCLRSEVCTAE